ncbi:hypothetical protein VNO77_32731 [Canavalia gladiata]|uniref:Uncharacterized protein n=1 Tax=Canavalia gladiata TaxID=3824 RepID=A0AAN9KUP1_CANGL
MDPHQLIMHHQYTSYPSLSCYCLAFKPTTPENRNGGETKWYTVSNCPNIALNMKFGFYSAVLFKGDHEERDEDETVRSFEVEE